MSELQTTDLPERLQNKTWKAMGDREVTPDDLVHMLMRLGAMPKRIMGTRHNDVIKRLLKREGLIEHVQGGWQLTNAGHELVGGR